MFELIHITNKVYINDVKWLTYHVGTDDDRIIFLIIPQSIQNNLGIKPNKYLNTSMTPHSPKSAARQNVFNPIRIVTSARSNNVF